MTYFLQIRRLCVQEDDEEEGLVQVEVHHNALYKSSLVYREAATNKYKIII